VSEDRTTAVVQRYLDELAGDSPAEPIVRALLDRAVRRLHLLGATLLHRSYPRLTRPPWNVQADELLGTVEERLLKALREARSRTVHQLFALANQHMRRELNDLAGRLDSRPAAVELCEGLVPAPASSVSGLSPDGYGRPALRTNPTTAGIARPGLRQISTRREKRGWPPATLGPHELPIGRR
jgi:RNA polymerase sigma-70 factor (ECF subfamily)